tara:strand:- start:220 stop:819 length:600 start_codon:yes stop_codon:yes gene_type:complete
MLKNLASKFNKQIKKVNVNSIKQNRIVLYVVGIFSLLYVLFLANQKDFNSVFVFAIVSFLLSFFTKNMILILITALLFTHFVKFTIHYKQEGMSNKKKKEGLENKKKEGMENEEEKEEEEEEPKLETNEIDVESTPSDMTEEEKKKKQDEYNKLKKEFVEFQSIQKDILKNMQEIDPLLNKAENFINKFEHYKKDKQTK